MWASSTTMTVLWTGVPIQSTSLARIGGINTNGYDAATTSAWGRAYFSIS